MNRCMTKLLSGFIWSKSARHRFRSRHMNPIRIKKPIGTHRVYGPVYAPCYNFMSEFETTAPEIYSREGKRLETFFIRDYHQACSTCSTGGSPRHFIWDRYNFGLKTHFYTHRTMLETMGSPDRRYGAFIESEAIVPEDYRIFDYYPGLYKDFDAIFTSNERMLDELPNAKFFPFAASPWYRGRNGIPDSSAFAKKMKNISFLCSDKAMCDLHRYRIELAMQCKREALADTFGRFDGGGYAKLEEPYEDYRYTIVVENDIKPYYFSERLTSSFVAMTIPIYIGASRIEDFFNPDGIILMKPGDDIHRVVAQCNERDYESRLVAIRDNFERVKAYDNMWDWLYERYL